MRARGMKVWIDEHEIISNCTKMKKQFLEGMKSSQVYVYFLTKLFCDKVNTRHDKTSEGCYCEVQQGVTDSKRKTRIIVIVDEEAKVMLKDPKSKIGKTFGGMKYCEYDDPDLIEDLIQNYYHKPK